MTITKQLCSWRLILLSAVMIASANGCSTSARTPTQTAGTARAALVEDCAIVAISSPARFACNGKVYTSFQLAKLRMEEEKKAAAGM